MFSWRDISFPKKIMLLMLGMCAGVLFIVGFVLFGFQYLLIEQIFRKDVQAIATIAATNSTGALAFNDSNTAREILGALRAKPQIVSARLTQVDGNTFAEYRLPGTRPFDLDNWFERIGRLSHSTDVVLDNERLGSLIVEVDYRQDFRELLVVVAFLLLGLLILSLLLVAFLSRYLHRLISTPLLELVKTALIVAREKNYGLRAQRRGKDEIGQLADAFNEMLSQIETRDATIKDARDRLADQLAQLEQEVAERQRLEVGLSEASQREQTRIANDLHDGLGQLLTGLAFKARLLQALLEGRGTTEAGMAKQLVELCNEATRQARDLAHGLSPIDQTENGIVHALRQLALRSAELFDIACDVMAPEAEPELSHTAYAEIYRIAQEAVNNAVRHGKAETIMITIIPGISSWIFEVTDDGEGLPQKLEPKHEGMGLKIMRHRARSLGGTIELVENPSGGVTLRCTIPRASTEIESDEFAARR